jgi:hypothetical protein
MKLDSLKLDKRILVIGSSGTGKTRLCGTLCKVLPTLLVTGDANGLETIRTMNLNPEVIFIDDWKQSWDYFKAIKEASSRCVALAIDDFGSIQLASRQKIERMPAGYREEKSQQAHPAEFEENTRRELMAGERRMQIQQWGELWIALESFLYEVLALPYAAKLVTVLEGVAENPRDNQDHIYPALQGQARTTIPARFSLVAEAFIARQEGKQYYCLTSRGHEKIETKDRFSTTGGRTWVNPDAAELLQYCEHRGTSETPLELKIGTGLLEVKH